MSPPRRTLRLGGGGRYAAVAFQADSARAGAEPCFTLTLWNERGVRLEAVFSFRDLGMLFSDLSRSRRNLAFWDGLGAEVAMGRPVPVSEVLDHARALSSPPKEGTREGIDTMRHFLSELFPNSSATKDP